MARDTLAVDQGLVDTPDRSTLEDGELSRALQCEYRIGTSELHKMPGRSIATTTGLASPVLQLHNLRYRDGVDKFVACTGDGKLHESASGTSLTFSEVLSGLDTTNVPQFSYFPDRWLYCNGVDGVKIREPNGINSAGWADGNWRPAGMLSPSDPDGEFAAVTATAGSPVSDFADTAIVAENSVTSSPHAVNFTGYTNPLNVANGTTTTTSNATIGGVSVPASSPPLTIVSEVSSTWPVNDASLDALTGRQLYIKHFGTTIDRNLSTVGGNPEAFFPLPSDVIKGDVLIEVSEDGGSAWTTVSEKSLPYPVTTTVFQIDDGTSMTGDNLRVRATTTLDTSVPSGSAWALSRIAFIKADNAIGNATSSDFDVEYGITERYYEEGGIVHESSMGPTLTVTESDFTNLTKLTLTLPSAPANEFASHFVIYRSLSEEGGGFPDMYEVAEIPIGTATWVDQFDLSLTSNADKDHRLETVVLIYPDGSTVEIPVNNPPPISNMALLFQGSVVYLPANSNKLFFSLSTATSPRAAEQVPEFYFLDFNTPESDEVKTAALTNGGRNLVVYSERYAMLVNYLPQATDPGVFDNRVKEYVSDKRGSAGTHTATTFSPDEGVSTLCASADYLGLWITDGVGLLKNWSKDIDWDGATGETGDSDTAINYPGNTSASLATSILIDNPEMRRLELIYDSDGAGDFREMHFFYGEMKRSGQPKITGPHPTGWRSKYYTVLSAAWEGFSGDDGNDGEVFRERQQDSDASEAEDASGTVTYDIETGEKYPFGLSEAGLVVYLYPKFRGGEADKAVTCRATFNKDGNTADYPFTLTKTFNTATDKKLFWRRYADRFRFRVTDSTATALPSLVGMEYTVRQMAGEGV